MEQPQIRFALVDDVPELVRLKELLMRDGWPFDIEVNDDWRERCAAVARELVASEHQVFFVIEAHPGARQCKAAAISSDASDTGGVSQTSGVTETGHPRLASCVSVAVHQHLPGPTGSGRSAYIGDMATDPQFRGRGYGSALLERALEWARHEGAEWASLFSTDSGRAMYVKAGFGPEGPFEHLSLGFD